MPSFDGLHGLVADIRVELAGQLSVLESHCQAVGDDLVQEFRGGYPLEVIVGKGESLDHGFFHGGCLLDEQPPEACFVGLLLFALEVAVKPDAEQAGANEERAQLTPRHPGQPSQLSHCREGLADCHEPDARHEQHHDSEEFLNSEESVQRIIHRV
ncbi:hypothetical protein [Nocardia puris]|uniref:hypothetical protein n=1 Tax=Nocardia puris TaxID=208602 RepID=UPI00082F1130|nr:hypothetical protein [Nocardia puris]